MSGSSLTNNPVPSALDRSADIRNLVSGKHLALFLDYDGTLSPIMPRPELAVLSKGMRRTLDHLRRHCTLAIISGRAKADVHKLVDVADIYYAGNHGFEIEGPHQSEIRHQKGVEFLDAIDRAYHQLQGKIGDISGVLIEHKKFSLSVHFRLVEEAAVPDIETAIDSVLTHFPKLRKHHGKKVFEVRPNIDWDKGKAVMWLLDSLRLDRDDVLPMYIGDDVTDEDAFRALKGKGIGIVVSDEQRDTAAEYLLRDPEEVQQFLEQLSTILQETQT